MGAAEVAGGVVSVSANWSLAGGFEVQLAELEDAVSKATVSELALLS